ncbi:MAG TPA: alpha/beta hydrolase [Chitinophagaceae bacterium]|nr:alpha/beta hydrolase [Chitinophagaceae bacterium]
MRSILFALTLGFINMANSQSRSYPHPVRFISLSIEKLPVKMAYMDVLPSKPNGETVMLLHGKNFNGYYWKDLVALLQENGYRVIVPDQVGWGRSGKPNIHYSFHLLAQNTKELLDSLGIQQVHLLGHSMGGMLAARFALLYPQTVKKLILENPIGLEDYRTFVPYQPTEKIYDKELKANFDSLKKYQQSYYPEWKPEYDQYVRAQYEALQIPSFKEATWASALTYQMIYEQPVVYEFRDISCPSLLLIGQEDRTILGKNLLSKEEAGAHGNYPALGKWLQQQIKNSALVEIYEVGHIPHIQAPAVFNKHLLEFLKN